MQIAITADLHLRDSNPERIENLEILVQQLLGEQIRHLIVAGDLFDDRSYARFDSLARSYPDMEYLIIPGNHDPDLRGEEFASGNIQVFAKPASRRIDQRLFLFLPYREGKTMGETIAGIRNAERLRNQPWVLVSHGDYAAPRPEENGGERGYYPLTREDLTRFIPVKAILGHIHQPNSISDQVVYPGSPYPISSDEYGQRRVLLLETKTASVAELPLTHPPLYLRAEIFLIPDGREEQQIRSQIQSVLAGQSAFGNLAVRAVLKGYSASRRKAESSVGAILSQQGISCSGVDLDSLHVSDQESLATLADSVRQRIAGLELNYEEVELLRQAVLENALQLVYGA
jgi:DNA repair exonuclease SbcCD nuclease subunit